MIIKFCLSLASKSASAYNELLRSSNVLTLPSLRTLRDYKNAIRLNIGFKNEAVEEPRKTKETFRTISILGYTCNLPVIAAVSDDASQNKTFYRIHSGLDDHPNTDIVYKTANLFACS